MNGLSDIFYLSKSTAAKGNEPLASVEGESTADGKAFSPPQVVLSKNLQGNDIKYITLAYFTSMINAISRF